MSVELWGLVGFSVLTLVYISVQGLIVDFGIGIRWGTGARDLPHAPHVLEGRATRALRNLLETAPVFIALALVIELSVRSSVMTQYAVVVYLTARVLYLPLYLAGVPWLRSLTWNIATGALAAMLLGILIA